jgi:CubicO group peptidase (beta-lactamase class C family)
MRRLSHALTALALTLLIGQPCFAQKSTAKAPDLAAIDQVVTSIMKEWSVPGLALGIVKDGKVLYLKGYGYRDVEKQLPVTPRTLMAIGSNSKSFTVTLMGMLVDQKKLDWDTPVRKYLTDFKLYDDYATEHMTPRDLVRHNSGLPRHDLVWYGRDVKRQQIYQRVRYLEPNVSFREKWQYQNLMFLTAGVLVERIWGRTWEDLVKGQIFTPLGMSRTLAGATGMDQTDDFSWAYEKRNGAVVRVPIRIIDEMGPAGSIVSSVEDMVKYIQFRMDHGTSATGPRISVAAENQMQSPQMVVGSTFGPTIWPGFENNTYGLGLNVATYRGHQAVAHGGGIDGFISQMSWLPKDKIGVMVLSNLGSPNPAPTIVVESIYDRLLGLDPIDYIPVQRARDLEAKMKADSAKQVVRSAQKQGTSPSHDLAAYAGTYEHPGYGRVIIRQAGNRLELALDAMVAPLHHYHYDVFEIGDPGSIVPLSGLASFSTNLKGEVDQVAIPFEPSVKPIVFKRVP